MAAELSFPGSHAAIFNDLLGTRGKMRAKKDRRFRKENAGFWTYTEFTN
jgi:hypothetical protein